MKNRQNKNIAFLIILLGVFVVSLLLSGCGTRKKQLTKREAISQTVTQTKGVDAKTYTETREYGERLTGSIPVKILHNDSSSVVFESKGGRLTLSNEGGNLHFDLEAKPTSATNSYKETRETADSTATTNTEQQQVESDTRKSWSPPWWVWLLCGAALLFLIYNTLRKLLKHF